MRCHRKSGSKSSARGCRSISPPVLWFARMQKYDGGLGRFDVRAGSVLRSRKLRHGAALGIRRRFSSLRAISGRAQIDIRPAALADLPRIFEIYNREVEAGSRPSTSTPASRPRRRLADRPRPLPPGHGRHRRRRGRRLGLDRALVPARRLPAHRRGLRLRRSRGPRRRHRQGAADRPRRPRPLDPRDLGPPRPDRPPEPGQRRRPRGGRLPLVRDPTPLRREVRPDPGRELFDLHLGLMTPAESRLRRPLRRSARLAGAGSGLCCRQRRFRVAVRFRRAALRLRSICGRSDRAFGGGDAVSSISSAPLPVREAVGCSRPRHSARKCHEAGACPRRPPRREVRRRGLPPPAAPGNKCGSGVCPRRPPDGAFRPPGELSLRSLDLGDLQLPAAAARHLDADDLAALAAHQGLADRRLVGELLLGRVRLGRADELKLAGVAGLLVLDVHLDADGDRRGCRPDPCRRRSRDGPAPPSGRSVARAWPARSWRRRTRSSRRCRRTREPP